MLYTAALGIVCIRVWQRTLWKNLKKCKKKSNQEHNISGHCFDDNGKRNVCLHEKKSQHQDELLLDYRRKEEEMLRRILELENSQQNTRAIYAWRHGDENR